MLLDETAGEGSDAHSAGDAQRLVDRDHRVELEGRAHGRIPPPVQALQSVAANDRFVRILLKNSDCAAG